MIYARTNASGTACAETALCGKHLDQSDKFPGDSTYQDGPLSEHVDCTGNEVLECQVCGVTT